VHGFSRDPSAESSPSPLRDTLDPAQQGYTIVHNYALYFWRPYLGNTAFALWELLLSFCYGDRDIAYPSIARLARIITNSDHSRAVITGRRRTAQDAHQQGALQILCREGLVQVMRRGHGPTARYTFRVLKSLPLLRPEQVARLCPKLQRDHAAWLERYGIDEQTYRQAFGDHSDAPGSTGYAPNKTGDAPSDRGHASHRTNNPQEKEPINHWWQKALTALRQQLPRNTFETCLLGSQVRSFQEGTLTLQASGPLAYQLLQQRLAPLIRRVLNDVSQGQVRQVHFVAAESETEKGEG